MRPQPEHDPSRPRAIRESTLAYRRSQQRRRPFEQAVPIFLTEIPPGYRDWKLVSVAHEAGELNDIRAILGNDATIKSYREGKLPFPDGAIIARIAWDYVPSEENNKVFGYPQSFVAGSAPTWAFSLWSKTQKSTPRPAVGVRSIR
jgi:hypothetical protein